jgi:hypothetical protein
MIKCRISENGEISLNRNGKFVDMRCPYGGGAFRGILRDIVNAQENVEIISGTMYERGEDEV